MRIRSDQIDIPVEKIKDYLLIKKEKNDKSKFLYSLGYSLENWNKLLQDIKSIALDNDLILQRVSEFGDMYSIKGTLKNKKIITIWLQQVNENLYRFITLYPEYEK